MSTSPTPQNDVIRLAQVDQSFKWPALFYIWAGAIWLLIGTALALVASLKMHSPDFLASVEWLTFGRARSAHLNAMAYGALSNFGFIIALWVMARLCQNPLRHHWLISVAGLFWNIGVLWGVWGIMNGGLTSIEWLEMPMQVAPLLATAYVLVGLTAVLTFKYRQSGHIYVSQWYILAGLFWFPWLYTVAQIMILWIPARGVVQPITNWWFAHNVLGLWLTPIAVATIYYLIPKVLGKPIYSYYLSLIGFWSLALFYNWAGMHHIIGGPFPAWLLSAGIVGSIMMFIPVIVTAINHHATVVGSFKKVWASPTLRFVVFGAMNYTVSSFFGSLMALRSVSLVTHFTQFTVGHAHQGVYGFFLMSMFGAIYFLLPRLLKKEWPSAFLIKLHWWTAAVGITVMWVALQYGGWLQGSQMNNPALPFMTAVETLKPYLVTRSISGIILTVSHIAFVVNVLWMVLYQPKKELPTKGPTLI